MRPEALDELAAALVRWAERPPLGPEQRTRLHGRVAENFSLSANARHVKELYKQLMSKELPSQVG